MTTTSILRQDFVFTLSSIEENLWYMYSKGFSREKKRVETDYINYTLLDNKIQINYLWIGCKLLDNKYRYKKKSILLDYPISLNQIEKYLSLDTEDISFSTVNLKNIIDSYDFERHMYLRDLNKIYKYFFFEEDVSDNLFYVTRLMIDLLSFDETEFEVSKESLDNLELFEIQDMLSTYNIEGWEM